MTVGWVHVFVCHLVESDAFTEIGGLVVDEKWRGAGIGRLLVEQAEAWARAKGCTSIRLRSNIIRQEAHQFYSKLGYRIVKTQHAFTKTL
ncbi:MAG: GNAT family N-acetyltransferase [Terriglobia bacterium]